MHYNNITLHLHESMYSLFGLSGLSSFNNLMLPSSSPLPLIVFTDSSLTDILSFSFCFYTLLSVSFLPFFLFLSYPSFCLFLILLSVSFLLYSLFIFFYILSVMIRSRCCFLYNLSLLYIYIPISPFPSSVCVVCVCVCITHVARQLTMQFSLAVLI